MAKNIKVEIKNESDALAALEKIKASLSSAVTLDFSSDSGSVRKGADEIAEAITTAKANLIALIDATEAKLQSSTAVVNNADNTSASMIMTI